MKSIKFSDKELEFIRQQYQVELEEAETYVENLKNILNKIGVPSTAAIEKPIEQEPKKRRGRKPSGKTLEKKEPKKRGRPFKAATVPTIVASLLLEAKTTKRDTEKKVAHKVSKKRGRKSKAVVVESKVQKKRGRPFKSAVSTNETKHMTIAKRGRRPRIAVVPTVENSPVTVAKRGRKSKVSSVPTSVPKKKGKRTKVSAVPTSQPKSVPTAEKKVEKKIVKKKSPYRRRRSNWGGVRLAPMSKPIKLKEPKEEPLEETAPVAEPIIMPTEEPIVAATGESIIPPTEQTNIVPREETIITPTEETKE